MLAARAEKGPALHDLANARPRDDKFLLRRVRRQRLCAVFRQAVIEPSSDKLDQKERRQADRFCLFVERSALRQDPLPELIEAQADSVVS